QLPRCRRLWRVAQWQQLLDRDAERILPAAGAERRHAYRLFRQGPPVGRRLLQGSPCRRGARQWRPRPPADLPPELLRRLPVRPRRPQDRGLLPPAGLTYPSSLSNWSTHTMSLKIRLARGGAKKRPYYRIVIADARSPRDGRFIDKIGSYNPMLPQG